MTATRFEGTLYRALNPRYAREPLSGRGAALFGGRFNAKGRETIYASLDVRTALREANQIGTLQPTTLVACRAALRPIFDMRDAVALAGYDLDEDELAAADWRKRMIEGAPVATQELAERLRVEGFAGLLVRSFARGATPDDLNLVILRWNTGADDRLQVIDDEQRLR